MYQMFTRTSMELLDSKFPKKFIIKSKIGAKIFEKVRVERKNVLYEKIVSLKY